MVDRGSWHTVCHTCSAEDVSSDYDEAMDFFDRHGGRGHNVELIQLDAPGQET